jgi:iron complex transport system substrate-binding protein
MKKVVLSLIFCLLASGTASGYERVVVLYAPASSVIKALGAGHRVVGRTRTDRTFPEATNVGSHLRPNIELIKALRPDLLVAGSRRAFPDEMARRFHSKIYRYDPRSIEELFQAILDLGELLDRRPEAEGLVRRLREKLNSIEPLRSSPGIIYEISQTPLKVAGQRSIVTAIIEAAGGRNLVKINRKHVILSPEQVIKLAPEFYIYQEGPMNRNPLPPKQRPYFSILKAKVIKVSEKEFARPGLNVIDAIIKLNRILKEMEDEK